MLRGPVAAVIVQMETVDRGLLLVEAAALERLGGDRYYTRQTQQTTDGIMRVKCKFSLAHVCRLLLFKILFREKLALSISSTRFTKTGDTASVCSSH
jgi:hypothetical protein